MKSIEVKGTARTIAERSSEQARALKAIRKDNGVPSYYSGQVKTSISLYRQKVCAIWFILRTSTWLT